MAKKQTGARRRWVSIGVVAIGALFTCALLAGGCKQESASEKAGREAREAFEKGKQLMKDGLDKGGEAAKQGIEKSQDAAKGFAKGWKEGGKK